MIQSNPQIEPRLLVVGDLDRLGPILHDNFASFRVNGVQDYLSGIAEIARAPTRAVLVGYDAACRNLEAAIKSIKSAVGADVPVVFCCEPAYENVGRRLLNHGADDYLIFPPEPIELERSLGLQSRKTARPAETSLPEPPSPTAEELARLADLLPRLLRNDALVLDAMAELLAGALDAEGAQVTADGRTGHVGIRETDDGVTVLTQLLVRAEQPVGTIGAFRQSGRQTFTAEDSARLDHYAVLFGRLLESVGRTNQWRDLALTDDLTGLPNRRHLTHFLNEKIRWAEREQRSITVLIFDIDDFKRYNDTYGHDAGDEILTAIGRLFVRCSRKTDLVARHGGDEFVVVFWDSEGPRLAGSHHPQHVIDVLHRFRKALRAHTFQRLGPEAQGSLTISGGLAQFPAQAATAAELLEAADTALLQAKKAGKDRFWLIGGGDVQSSSTAQED
ncbi:MAG: diguanylate cyclase [Phycisphaerae bacterium]